MIYFKRCPKCRGDLYLGEDIHGHYVSCIQCGYLRDVVMQGNQEPVWETYVIDAPKTAKKPRKKIRQAA